METSPPRTTVSSEAMLIELGTTAAVIPSAQLAFESEMGYSLWRWALLALCVLLLLAGAAMLVYTAYLGVERVEAAMVQMH